MIYLDREKLNPERFNDGTLKLALGESETFLHDVVWIYENDAELFELACVARHIQELGDRLRVLSVPYVPNARMDRTDRTNYASFVYTMKYFAEFVNGLGFSSVRIFDPHSDVCAGLLNNVRVVQPFDVIDEVVREIGYDNMDDPVFYFPDRGSMSRYFRVTGGNKPFLFGDKRRNWDTREITSMSTYGHREAVRGHCVLMLDDICSSGETLLRSAEMLKQLGAGNLYVYVSHCENSVPDSRLLKSGLITKLYTTDSLFTGESPLIEVKRIWTDFEREEDAE